MYKIGGYIVECRVEEYQDGWRSIVRVSHALPFSTGRRASAQYSVPALYPAASAAKRAAFVWAGRLIETNGNSIELALADAELEDVAKAYP